MDKETAQITLELLNRVQLTGGEVPAYAKVVKSLNDIIKGNEEKENKDTKK